MLNIYRAPFLFPISLLSVFPSVPSQFFTCHLIVNLLLFHLFPSFMSKQFPNHSSSVLLFLLDVYILFSFFLYPSNCSGFSPSSSILVMVLGFLKHDQILFHVCTYSYLYMCSLMIFLKHRRKEVKCIPPIHTQFWQSGFTLIKCCTSFLGLKLLYLAKRKIYTVNK